MGRIKAGICEGGEAENRPHKRENKLACASYLFRSKKYLSVTRLLALYPRKTALSNSCSFYLFIYFFNFRRSLRTMVFDFDSLEIVCVCVCVFAGVRCG